MSDITLERGANVAYDQTVIDEIATFIADDDHDLSRRSCPALAAAAGAGELKPSGATPRRGRSSHLSLPPEQATVRIPGAPGRPPEPPGAPSLYAVASPGNEPRLSTNPSATAFVTVREVAQ